jgi:hypothetical protein
MNSIFTPDKLITVLGLAISIGSLLFFWKMSRKLLGAVILTLTIVFGAQTWFFLQFERSVDQARHAILQYVSKDTRTEWTIAKHLSGSFDPMAITDALNGLQSEGIIKRKTIELVRNEPHGEITFEFLVYCNPKAREQAGLNPYCD